MISHLLPLKSAVGQLLFWLVSAFLISIELTCDMLNEGMLNL